MIDMPLSAELKWATPSPGLNFSSMIPLMVVPSRYTLGQWGCDTCVPTWSFVPSAAVGRCRYGMKIRPDVLEIASFLDVGETHQGCNVLFPVSLFAFAFKNPPLHH